MMAILLGTHVIRVIVCADVTYRMILICRLLRDKPEARALILVKERELTIAVKRFLAEHVTLKREKLTVERFVGGGASQTEAGASSDC